MIFLFTSFIYLSVGTEIYKKRKHLRSMASRSLDTVQSMKRVEVQITTEIAGESRAVGQDGKFSQYAAFVSSAEHTNANTSNALKSTPKMSSSDAAAWAYTKCAMLFFAALLITWVSNHSIPQSSIALMWLGIGAVYNQPCIHPGSRGKGQLCSLLFRGTRTSSPRILELHHLHHHISRCLPKTMGITLYTQAHFSKDCSIKYG